MTTTTTAGEGRHGRDSGAGGVKRPSRVRVEFRLSMPSRASWDGRWSGADRNYVLYQTVSRSTATELFGDKNKASWFHRWDDGWGAAIDGRIMEAGERQQKSDGFCGYDWMVRNILAYGSPYTTGAGEGMAGASA